MVSLRRIASGHTEPALVLIHAFPVCGLMYSDAATRLAASLPKRQILLVDLPGFGDAPYREHWTISDAMVSLNKELRARGFSSCTIGGSSMGGYAAFAYYRLFPNEVESLVLSTTKAEADDDVAKRAREIYAIDVEKRGVQAVIDRQLRTLVGKTTQTSRPHLFSKLEHVIRTTDPKAIASALRALAVREDSTDLLANITCRSLVVRGNEDEIITPEITASLTNAIRNSSFAELPRTGHLAPFETPDAWASVVSQFVSDL